MFYEINYFVTLDKSCLKMIIRVGNKPLIIFEHVSENTYYDKPVNTNFIRFIVDRQK